MPCFSLRPLLSLFSPPWGPSLCPPSLSPWFQSEPQTLMGVRHPAALVPMERSLGPSQRSHSAGRAHLPGAQARPSLLAESIICSQLPHWEWEQDEHLLPTLTLCFVSWSCHSKAAQTGAQNHRRVSSQGSGGAAGSVPFWTRWVRGVRSVPLSRLLAAPVLWPPHPTSASVLTCTSSLCLCVCFSPWKHTSHWMRGPFQSSTT